jgi:hypothetical protein
MARRNDRLAMEKQANDAAIKVLSQISTDDLRILLQVQCLESLIWEVVSNR